MGGPYPMPSPLGGCISPPEGGHGLCSPIWVAGTRRPWCSWETLAFMETWEGLAFMARDIKPFHEELVAWTRVCEGERD